MSQSLISFIHGSAHDLAELDDNSVQCIVTSPPYYGLRKYEGAQDVEWPAVEYAPVPGLSPIRIAGCEPECEHEWEKQPSRKPGQVEQTKWKSASAAGDGQTQAMGAYCSKCGGWRGGLGNEPTLDMYIGHLILCMREWWRVLRNDGVCFVNLGDSYSGSGGAGGDYNSGGLRAGQPKFKAGTASGLKPKDLMLVPHRFALAAQADGWWVRSDIIGAKVAPMPESVTDRPTRSHEHIWMLTKAAKYFWDAEAVREKALDSSVARMRRGVSETNKLIDGAPGQVPHTVHQARSNDPDREVSTSRQMRDVIEWRPKPFPGAHFAVWPEAIPERCIRAATSERGCCPHCGAPWARVVEKSERVQAHWLNTEQAKARAANGKHGSTSVIETGQYQTYQTVGWKPTCTCPDADPVPCSVLDPFVGSGTTVKVAVALGRRGIGVDISREYLETVVPLRLGIGVQMILPGL